MKIRCPQCEALHTFDAAKLPARAIQVKCKKCAHPFDIKVHLHGQRQQEPQEKETPALFTQKSDNMQVDANNEAAVIKSLYEGIVRYVNQKKFREADGLRHQLMKIAPMALSEIFSTGEIIEQNKMMAMDPEKIKHWANLYDRLNPSETVAFKKGLVRRAHKRHRVSLNGQVQMADPDGNRIIGRDIANVKLVDVSAGGLCYMVQNLKMNKAEQHHKQWVNITIQYKKDHVFQEMKTLAQIVSLKFYPFEECAVHVRFKKPIDDKKVIEMAHYSELQG